MKNKNYIIFSDLDGTLLDHDTYEYAEARHALDTIKNLNIPLILTSSKTKVEMEKYQVEMGIQDFPFIVENGSAIYTQPDYFKLSDNVEQEENFDCIRLGKTYEELKEFLEKISSQYNHEIRGFHNTNKTEIIKETKLTQEQVELALLRDFSIPIFYEDRAKEILKIEIKKNNLHMLYGGRFIHILGKTDKGKALEIVNLSYKEKWKTESTTTIGIGDTMNDKAMLEKADIKVLVKRYNNEYDKRVEIDNLILSPYIGPKGWNYTILDILSSGDNNE